MEFLKRFTGTKLNPEQLLQNSEWVEAVVEPVNEALKNRPKLFFESDTVVRPLSTQIGSEGIDIPILTMETEEPAKIFFGVSERVTRIVNSGELVVYEELLTNLEWNKKITAQKEKEFRKSGSIPKFTYEYGISDEWVLIATIKKDKKNVKFQTNFSLVPNVTKNDEGPIKAEQIRRFEQHMLQLLENYDPERFVKEEEPFSILSDVNQYINHGLEMSDTSIAELMKQAGYTVYEHETAGMDGFGMTGRDYNTDYIYFINRGDTYSPLIKIQNRDSRLELVFTNNEHTVKKYFTPEKLTGIQDFFERAIHERLASGEEQVGFSLQDLMIPLDLGYRGQRRENISLAKKRVLFPLIVEQYKKSIGRTLPSFVTIKITEQMVVLSSFTKQDKLTEGTVSVVQDPELPFEWLIGVNMFDKNNPVVLQRYVKEI